MEEVDELFEAKLAAWKFSSYETHGAARLLAALENEGMTPEKAEAVEVELRGGEDKGKHLV